MTAWRTLFIIERALLWFLWGVWCGAAVVYRLVLAGQRHNTTTLTFPTDAFPLVMLCVPTALALSMRWLVIPRLKTPFVGLIPFLIGLTAAEVLTFFGLFLFERHFLLFFCVTWALLLQFVPIWRQQAGPPPLPPSA